jgi:U3 small nucleolar RNA-associated protein 23
VQECIAALVGEENPHHYGIITDVETLKNTARRIAGVPLVFLERTFPLLETPSKRTLDTLRRREEAKLHVSTREKEILKQKFGEAVEPVVKSKHKRRKLKGPNPLSVRKALKTDCAPVASTESGPKRRRRRRKKP